MKISITTFNNLKMLKANQVGVSTAISDPPWFHLPKQPYSIFKYHLKTQNRDQWYGYRIKDLSPYLATSECAGCNKDHPETCTFLKTYKEQLFNKISFNKLIENLKKIQQDFTSKTNIQDPEIVLLVYEKPENPCSERHAIIELFKSHNIDVKEIK